VQALNRSLNPHPINETTIDHKYLKEAKFQVEDQLTLEQRHYTLEGVKSKEIRHY
jgi:hypothetical protein